jgi:5-methylcytosine-specific restriction endonuclease McrA
MKQNSVTVGINKEHPLVSDFMSLFKSKVGLDLSFNRQESWEEKQRSKYLSSLVSGQAPSKIIVANIEECLSLTLEGTLDYQYFKHWQDLGFKFIAIDGNNRTQTIDLFLQGKVAIEHGIYVLPTGSVSIHAGCDNYKTLPKIFKDYIKENITITLCEYVVATRSGLSRLFTNINDGVTLNPQELRNATLVPFADAVRNMVTENRSSFRTIFKDNNRLKIDEQIVLMAVYSTFGAEHGVSKKDKDQAYEDNSAVWINFSTQGGEKRIVDTLKIVDKYAKKSFKYASTLLNFFMVIVELSKQKRTIKDKGKLMTWFLSTEAERLASEEILVKKNNGELRNYSSCCDVTSEYTLTARLNFIRKDMAKLTDDIVTELDPDRLFTTQQRFQMWKKQNGVCIATGKTIPQDEINDHELWNADHIVAWILGGETNIENGQLVCSRWNKSKGKKLTAEFNKNHLIAA